MMLEPFAFRRNDDSFFPDEEAAPFRAHHVSSGGGPFTVALVISEPPKISRLYLRWPGGLYPEEGTSCDLVAAHRNLLVFRLSSRPLKKDECLVYPQEYFISMAPSLAAPYSQPQPLVLQNLPMCTKRSFHVNTVGILCRGEAEFAVAQLSLSRRNTWAKMEGELCVMCSRVTNLEHRWEVKRHLQIEYKEDELSDLVYWKTDTVIPFGNYLCWVSYSDGGILFCNVFEEKPTITYLRFPTHYRPPIRYLHRFHNMSCSVCVTEGGNKLMFVDVARKDNKLVGPMIPGSGFTVTCHSLGQTKSSGKGWEWNKIFDDVRSDQLWDINISLPHEPLIFPLVSMFSSNLVYFLLSEKGKLGIGKVSVIALDMITKKVSIYAYIKGGEDLRGKDDDMVRGKSRLLHPFIPSELPKFLGLFSSTGGED